MKISGGTCIIEWQLKIKSIFQANILIYVMIFEKRFTTYCVFPTRMYYSV